MTTAHVEKFAELVGKDPALLAKLGLDKANADAAAASASLAAFITNSVIEAKALGLEFTEAQYHAFIAAEANTAAKGELSDSAMNAVAGGLSRNYFNYRPQPVTGTTPIGVDKVNFTW
jgi:hypothetical protein